MLICALRFSDCMAAAARYIIIDARYCYRNSVWCTKYFDVMNRLDVDHQCDRRPDRQTDANNYDSNSVRLTMCAKNHVHVTFLTAPFRR